MYFVKSLFFIFSALTMLVFSQTDTGHYYLMSYFKDVYAPLNDMSGGFFATSTDGINWTELNDGKPVLTPYGFGEKRMRDPFLFWDAATQTFHLVYTTGWNTKDIGYTSITPSDGKLFTNPSSWTPQVSLKFGDDIAGSLCCWAPEILWDDIKQKFMIFWSTETGVDGKRAYYSLTSDFKTFTKAEKFFDPGFTEIDACMLKQADQKYYMFFKDERTGYKKIYYVTGTTPQGPWSAVSESITALQGVEGPTAIKIGNEYRVYFDPYNARQNYRMVKSTDLVTWKDGGTIKSAGLNFYYSHCNIIEIPKNIYDWINTGKISVRQKLIRSVRLQNNQFDQPSIYSLLGKRIVSAYTQSHGDNGTMNLPSGYFITSNKTNMTGKFLQLKQ